MIANPLARTARAAAVVLAMIAVPGTARAQQPTPAAIDTARQVLELKGAKDIYDPMLVGVIEQAKNLFLQTNPALGKDLNEVAARMRAEYAPRLAELTNEVARSYAQRFTEQELREILAFYKTPLGRKLLAEEPRIIEEGLLHVQQWADRFSEEVVSKMRAEMKRKGHDL